MGAGKKEGSVFEFKTGDQELLAADGRAAMAAALRADPDGSFGRVEMGADGTLDLGGNLGPLKAGVFRRGILFCRVKGELQGFRRDFLKFANFQHDPAHGFPAVLLGNAQGAVQDTGCKTKLVHED